MNHTQMDADAMSHAALSDHGMGPGWMGALYLALIAVAVLCHLFNLMRPEKLARLSEADKDARANRMERNMLYICVSHVPMGLAWAGLLAPLWAVFVGVAMLYGEAHLAWRSYQRAKQIYAL